jgi:hypothetical protein
MTMATKIKQITTGVGDEMKEIARTLLGVRDKDWEDQVYALNPDYLPDPYDPDDDEKFQAMPEDMRIRLRVAQMMGIVLQEEADFVERCGEELVELRELYHKARPARRAA